MTGAPPVPNRTALWAALSNMQIDLPGTSTRFEEALAQEQGWTLEFAERVTDEYRRFLYLAATAGFEVTPSRTVDEAWHFHLRCPHYREVLCGRILRRPLEHRPATGEPGESERHRGQYERTAALYGRAFLKPPPFDIWPEPVSPTDRQAERDRRQVRNLAQGVAVAAGLGALAAYALAYPMIALFLAAGALIVALAAHFAFTPKARNRGSAGPAGGCGGGGWTGWDSEGSASCGGGGCGGGD